MNFVTLRPILAPLVGIALCFAVGPRPGAAVAESPIAAQFVAPAVSPSGVVGGRIDILVATDQNLGFGGRILVTRTLQPEVTLLEMRFDRDGKGTGKLAPAMSIV